MQHGVLKYPTLASHLNKVMVGHLTRYIVGHVKRPLNSTCLTDFLIGTGLLFSLVLCLFISSMHFGSQILCVSLSSIIVNCCKKISELLIHKNMPTEGKNCLSFCWTKTGRGLNWLWKDLKKPHLVLIKILCMLQSIGQVRTTNNRSCLKCISMVQVEQLDLSSKD